MKQGFQHFVSRNQSTSQKESHVGLHISSASTAHVTPSWYMKTCLLYFSSEYACCKGFGSSAEGFDVFIRKSVAAGSRLAFGTTTVCIDVCLRIESREIHDSIGWWSLRLWIGGVGLNLPEGLRDYMKRD